MARFSSKTKKWITVSAMTILASSTITAPIDLSSYLPELITKPCCGQFSLLNIIAYVVLLGGYWIFTSQTE